jgi:hypothetical protein
MPPRRQNHERKRAAKSGLPGWYCIDGSARRPYIAAHDAVADHDREHRGSAPPPYFGGTDARARVSFRVASFSSRLGSARRSSFTYSLAFIARLPASRFSQSMIPKSGNRFSEKIMLRRKI